MKKGWIYRITFKGSNMVYYGQTVTLKRRMRTHLGELNRGKHANDIMQKCFNKHGESAFRFDVVEIVEVKHDWELNQELNEAENAWISTIWGKPHCVNLREKAVGGPMSEAVKQKIRKALKGLPKSEEHKQKLRKARLGRFRGKENAMFGMRGEKAPSFGRKHTEEWKQEASERAKKQWCDPKERKKQSERAKKRYNDPEERKKQSERMKAVWAKRREEKRFEKLCQKRE